LDGRHFGELYDFWGGLSDLKKGLVRVLHSLSFVDDPTRILRAVRFEQRFGFSIEKRTLELLHQARDLLNDVSGDRIRHELELIIKEKAAPAILSRMAELNLFPTIFPEVEWSEEIRHELERFHFEQPGDEWRLSVKEKGELKLYGTYIILLSPLESGSVLKVCKRLRIKNHLRKNILDSNKLLGKIDQLAGKQPSDIANFLENFSQIVIFCLFFITKSKTQKKILEQFATQWRWIEPSTNGDILKSYQLEPGPIYKQILSNLKAAWINGEIKNEDEEMQHLINLLSNISESK